MTLRRQRRNEPRAERTDAPPPGETRQPPVDIWEEEDGLVLRADLPGVSPDRLDVRVERDTLTFRGRVEPAPDGEDHHREWEAVDFHRSFSIGDLIDRSAITAELEHGVLTLRLPKAPEARPRTIDIEVG